MRPFIDQEEAVADSGVTGYWCKNRANTVARSGVVVTRGRDGKAGAGGKAAWCHSAERRRKLPYIDVWSHRGARVSRRM